MKQTILVTGGTGFIGSHTCVELLTAGFEVVILDNLSNSRRSVVERIARIAGRQVTFVGGDIRDAKALDTVFATHKIEAVIHFAGLKAVGESVEKPLLYYDNNVAGTLALIAAMERANVHRMVFSSSSTVYGDAVQPPFREDAMFGPTNPYGRTKLMIEQILKDLSMSRPEWKVVLLRYFNPVGAHESGILGEDPNGIPNNLMPYVSKVAIGELAQLSVFGNDYPTPDGTCVRDYIHVVDLAVGHVAAFRAIEQLPPVSAFNLGTGRGYSVLDLVKAFERACGRSVPYRVAPRRAGDVAVNYADPSRAATELGWRATCDLDAMCRDAWRWQQWQAEHTAEL
jgi:UDP-glucose 4-epimerase